MSPGRNAGGTTVDFALEWFKNFVSEPDHPVGLLLLFGAALFEYVFPPFPGDIITLFGSSVLVTRYHWNWIVVFFALLAGSQVGAMLAFRLGKRWAPTSADDLPHTKRRLNRLVTGFARYGPAYLIINRFIPVFRPLFFVAAGMANMKPRTVFLYSTISSALWNGLLMILGIAVGVHFDTLVAWGKRYTLVALGIVLLIVVATLLIKRRRRAA